MGITVANVHLATGVVVANAYVAVSRNAVTLYPLAGQVHTFDTRTVYGIWNSYDDRVADRGCVDARILLMQWDSAASVGLAANATPSDALYTDIYAAIKEQFDNHEDVDPDDTPLAAV